MSGFEGRHMGKKRSWIGFNEFCFLSWHHCVLYKCKRVCRVCKPSLESLGWQMSSHNWRGIREVIFNFCVIWGYIFMWCLCGWRACAADDSMVITVLAAGQKEEKVHTHIHTLLPHSLSSSFPCTFPGFSLLKSAAISSLWWWSDFGRCTPVSCLIDASQLQNIIL